MNSGRKLLMRNVMSYSVSHRHRQALGLAPPSLRPPASVLTVSILMTPVLTSRIVMT